MAETNNLGLPFIEAGQAQKHVTLNESLRILDAAIHMSVAAITSAAPGAPDEGERHIVGVPASGAFEDRENEVATFEDGAWRFLEPRTGWRAWVEAEDILYVFDGEAWRDLRDLAVSLDDVTRLGVNAVSEGGNLLTVRSNAALFYAIPEADEGNGDAQIQISKESAADKASWFFATGFAPRAEIGLIGDDELRFKVSPDGDAWQEAIVIARESANVALKSSLTLSGRITPDALTANANDYAPDGFASAAVLRLSGTAVREITGIAGGSDGRVVVTLNAGTYPLTLKNESASSSAGNRFGFAADVTLAGKQAAVLWYDSTAARWKLLAGPAPSSSGGLDDTTRRNLHLVNIALAKTRGAHLRLLGEFADGYAAGGGINAGASSNYTHDGTNKLARPGVVPGSDEATSAFAISSGDFDGTHTKGKAFDNTNGTSNEWYSQQLSSTPVNGNAWIGQDFGAGNAKDIRSVTIKQGYNDANARVTSAKVQYSDNGSAWTDVQTLSLATDTSVQSFSLPSSGARRYWRLLANANTAGGLAWVVDEIEFRGADTINNMTLVTAAQTADAAPASVRALLEIEAVDAITLDTDLTIEVSRDGGATWTSASLFECGGTASGRIAAETAETSVSAQPSGTSVCARIRTFNNKRVNIHGLDLRWS